ncbi:MAG: alanine--tRNA ligase, partial [Methanobrevibacter sp.]|nr:alanine--tRNA ligase [Methanobrevibacter sp.]
QIAGMMDIEDIGDLKELRQQVADSLNLSLEDYLKAAEPMEAIYIIADHTRCLAFMIADGIIPSNVKEGYLARLVLRRTIRFMKELDMKESLADVMAIQLDFLSKFYPEIRESEEHIMNIITLEEERYAATVKKGKSIVKRSIKRLKKEGKSEMPLDMLIDLYDAHGIPPETVVEMAGDGFTVNVPDNFFTQVAGAHEKDTSNKKSTFKVDYPETDLLFYKDFYQKEFEAEVLGIVEKDGDKCLIFDKTVFYPEGGGQPSDIGIVSIDGNDINMKHAEKIDNVVLHHVDEDISDDVVGKKITGKLDWTRRITLARHHTGTHLVIAAARKVLGQHIWQAGSQNGLTRARIDLSHYKRITQEELNEIEKLANEYVMDNIDLDIQFHTRDEAQELYGFVLYQGGIVPGKMIRVVKVPGVDVQACAGTHVLRTGVVGPIKINKTERVQDGVERIDFSAGLAAIDSMQHDNELLRESSAIFKVENDQLPKTCDRFFSEWKSQKNEIDRLKSEIASLKMNSLADDFVEINGLKVISEKMETDIKELQKIATDFTDNGKADVVIMGNGDGKIVGAASQNAIDNDIKINEIIKTAAGVLGGGGGGRLTLAQGAGKNADKMDEAIQTAVDLIKG